jgi:predicted dinucleotide-binding enzyme
MGTRLILLILVALGSLYGRVLAQGKPVVAMIGTGTLAGEFGPALGRGGYPVVYGSRDPDRDVVRALVARTGANAMAVTQGEAVARAEVIILAVPADALEEVTRNLGNLNGKILVDVSGGVKRVAADGYLELVSDSAYSERIQAWQPTAHVVRVNLPINAIPFFIDPAALGTPPTVLIASDHARARQVVADIMFNIGLDPWDAGPLRFSRVFDALNTMLLVPLQQQRSEGYELKLVPGVPLSCFLNVSEFFGFGRPNDLDDLRPFPRRDPAIPCDEWLRRLGIGE